MASAAGGLAPGQWAAVHGLAARADLNGSIGVVQLTTGKEGETLKAAGRVKVRILGTGEVIAIKLANLTPDDGGKDDKHAVDWTVLDKPVRIGIHDIILKSPVGKVARCDELVAKLRTALLAEGQHMRAARFEAEMANHMVAHASKLHAIYFLSCTAAGHELVLESHDGRARVFQALRPGGSPGYSALEWASPDPQPAWPPELVQAHRRWGGCRELSTGELRDFLGRWVAVQQAGRELVAAVQARLPDRVQGAQRDFERDLKAGTSGPSPVAVLAGELRADLAQVSRVRGEGGWVVASTAAYRGEAFSFTVPDAQDAPFSAAWAAVTGRAPGLSELLALLNFVDWQRAGVVNAQGEVDAVGWAVQAFRVPH